MAEQKSKFDRGIFLQLRGGMTRFVVKVDNEEITAGDADRRLLSVRKQIINCDEYRAIIRAWNNAKDYLAGRAIYCPYLASCMYLIPLAVVDEAIERMDGFTRAYDEAVEAFVAVYERAKRDARERLKNLYREEDYPAADEVRSRFKFEWEFKDAGQVFGVPTKLKDVKAALYTQQVRRAVQRQGDVEETIKYGFREQLRGLVAHLADRLSPDAKGERKVLRQGAVENVTEWLDAFGPKGEMMGDAETGRIVAQCRKVLQGVDVKELKDDAKAQEQIAASMALVKGNLDKMLEKRPTRLIGGEV